MINNLEYVLKDFHDCVNLPIQFLDKRFNVLYEEGFSIEIKDTLNDFVIYEDIKKCNMSIANLTYLDNIHFIILPVLNNRSYEGYFLVGPFKSQNSSNNLDIPFKPLSCIKYIELLLTNIVTDKLKRNVNFNTYIKEAVFFIHNNYNKDIKIDDLCSYLNLNRSYFCTLFKKELGITYSEFLNKFRIEKSKKLLLDKNLSVLDVALSVGYNNQNYYTTIFKKINSLTPLEYRKQSHNTL